MQQPAAITTAFILGAGLGTRLRPLTDNCPKPILPVNGKPMIAHALDHICDFGVTRIIINTHHKAECYDKTFPEKQWRGVPLLFRHEPILLETGGGIKNIEDLVPKNDHLLVYNGDIITSLPLKKLVDEHFNKNNEATLALRSTGGPLHIGFDPSSGKVLDIREQRKTAGLQNLLFTGVYVIAPEFFKRLTPDIKMSVIPTFQKMIYENNGNRLGGVITDEGDWSDVGTIEEYNRLNSAK